MSRQQIQFPVQQVQIATPPVPPSGSMRLYPKNDGNFYKLNSAGVEAQVGSVYVHPDPFTIGTLTVTSTLTVGGATVRSNVADFQSDAALIAGNGYLFIGSAKDTYFTRTGPAAATLVGSLTTASNIQGRWLYTNDGSNGVVQAGAGSLFLRSASGAYQFDSGGLVNITGGLTAGGTVTGGYVTSAGGMSASGHVVMGMATGGIGTSGSSEGQLELQNAGSGAAKIAFHRTGAYAAYLGLDTDNQWAVGGWSMGAARYVLITDAQTQTLSNKTMVSMTHSGNLTMSGGYIYGTYINMSADVAGGKPAYVAGQNGDGFLRWYTPASIGPPAAGGWSRGGACNSGGADVLSGRFLNVGDSGGSAIVSYVGDTRVIVSKNGYYFFCFWYGGSNAVWSDNKYIQPRIYLNGGYYGSRFVTDTVMGNSGGTCRATATGWGYLAAGTVIQFWANQGAAGAWTWVASEGAWELYFIPTAEYPN